MEKNMHYNFERLKDRVVYSLNNSEIEEINKKLASITGPTLVSGVGGSSVVADYASKILEEKNKIITKSTEPRDFRYLNLDLYNNTFMCSYSGNNYAVDLSLSNNLKKYLLSSYNNSEYDVVNLTYDVLDKEESFISLGATLIPCGILLNYYLDNDKDRIITELKEYSYDFDVNCDAYEIFSGIDTSTPSKFLESTMVESGIGIPIIHDKYSYCHGRSTLSRENNDIAIYLNTFKELDELLLEEIPKYYKDVIVIDCEEGLLNEYISLIKCMYLTKYIAEEKKKDLSLVDYSPVVKKLYKYKGDL